MSTVSFFTEVLESRTFLSASGDTALNSTVLADRAAVQAALNKFRGDIGAGLSTLRSDVSTLQADGLKDAKSIHNDIKKFRHDINKMLKSLRADRLDESSAVLADESTILKDRAQLLRDRGNKTAVSADKAALRADHVKLQNDIVAGLTSRINERQNDYTQIFNDGQAITTDSNNDGTLSAQLKTDLAKWVSDRTTLITTLTADLTALKAARAQLSADLAASTN